MQLIFIYNAKSDLFSKATDFAHKLISPKTYACELCSLTYGSFSMEKRWKEFLESLPYQKRFFYKDDWQSAAENNNIELPAILIKAKEGEQGVLISKQEMQQMQSLEDLILLMKERIRIFNKKEEAEASSK